MILKDPERHDKDEYLNGEEEEDEGWNEFYGLGDIKAEKELDFTSETK